jgi:hypothetical protein
MLDQQMRELGYRKHEDEVEKELNRGDSGTVTANSP